MKDEPISIDPDDEELVAYLDGELPADRALLIEQRIAEDSVVRHRVQELEDSWKLLDELPVSPPNPKLAETTIELVAMRLREERRLGFLGGRVWLIWLLLSTLTVVAFAVGAVAAVGRQRSNAQQLVRTLPLLTRYADLKLIDNPIWMERLAQVDSLIEAGLPLYQEVVFPEEPTRRSELDEWLNQLEPTLRLRLYENYQSFQGAPPDRKNVIRDVIELISTTKSPNYSEILKAYSGLVSQIGSAELAQIEADQDLDQRAAKIEQVVSRELAIAFANRLSHIEKESIRQWANELKEEHFEYFVELEDPDSDIVLMLDMPSADSIIQPKDIEDLIARLSVTGQDLLNQLDERQRLKALRLWVYTSLPTNRPRPQLSGQALQQMFRTLPLELQNELIYLPGSEVIKALSERELEPEK